MGKPVTKFFSAATTNIPSSTYSMALADIFAKNVVKELFNQNVLKNVEKKAVRLRAEEHQGYVEFVVSGYVSVDASSSIVEVLQEFPQYCASSFVKLFNDLSSGG